MFKRDKLEIFQCKGLAPYFLCKYLEYTYTKPRPNVQTHGYISIKEIIDITLACIYDLLANFTLRQIIFIPMSLILLSVKYMLMRIFGWLLAMESVCFTGHELAEYQGNKVKLYNGLPDQYDNSANDALEDYRKMDDDFIHYYNDSTKVNRHH